MTERASRQNYVYGGDLVSCRDILAGRIRFDRKYRTQNMVLVVRIGLRGASLRTCL